MNMAQHQEQDALDMRADSERGCRETPATQQHLTARVMGGEEEIAHCTYLGREESKPFGDARSSVLTGH